MAIINCPDCGKEVSNYADKCPQCAYPINSLKKSNLLQKSLAYPHSSRCGCTTVLIVILLILIFSLL